LRGRVGVGGRGEACRGPGAGHEHVHLGPDAVSAVPHVGEVRVRAGAHPPVGHHAALIAPLAPEDGGAQVVVVVAPHAVDLVVAGHDGVGGGLFHADLEALQVDLPQGSL